MSGESNTIDKFGRRRRLKIKDKLIRGLSGIGFKLTPNGDYDIQQKRLCNLSEPIEKTDATSRQYVEERIKRNASELSVRIEKYVVSAQGLHRLISGLSESIHRVETEMEKENSEMLTRIVKLENFLQKSSEFRKTVIEIVKDDIPYDIQRVESALQNIHLQLSARIDKIDKFINHYFVE